jgi:hypothetical protein
MSTRQYAILIALVALMTAVAVGLGRWSEQLNPAGIQSITESATDATTTIEAGAEEPRNAFTFGASMGLLGSALLYCLIAAGLLLRARSLGRPPGRFAYFVAGLAAVGFVLSYLIDDYFY